MVKRAAATAVIVVLVVVTVLYWRHGAGGDAGIQHWLAVHSGTDNEASPYYGFFSGFGADLSEAAILGAITGMITGLLHKHNCHERGCLRLGRHQVDGSPWCDRHHETARDRAAEARRAADPLTAVGKKLDRVADEMAGLAEAIRVSLAGPR